MSGQLHTHAWHRITLVLYSIITLALSVTCTQGISHDHDTLYLLSKFKEAAFGGEYDVQTRSNPSPFLGLLGTLGDVLRFPAAFKSETIAVRDGQFILHTIMHVHMRFLTVLLVTHCRWTTKSGQQPQRRSCSKQHAMDPSTL